MDIQSLTSVQSPVYVQGDAQVRTAAGESVVPEKDAAKSAGASAGKETVSPGQLQEMVDKISQTIQSIAKDLQFSVDEETGESVVKVVDAKTKEVIRQFPSEEILAISKRLDELSGLLIKQKV